MLDYKLLEALASVLEAGSFEAAARHLHLTQSAVSQRVKLLETRCGQPLLIRGSPVLATPKGQQLLKHCRQVQLLEAELASFSDAPQSTFISLPIAVNADSLVTWFIDAIGERARQRNWLLDLLVEDQDETLRLLKHGEVIGCISAEAQPPQGCRSTALGAMRYQCVANSAFAARYFPDGIDADALARAPAVTYSSKDRLHADYLDRFWQYPADGFPRHRVPSVETFLEAIVTGLGYGLVPEQMLSNRFPANAIEILQPCRMLSVDLYWQCWGVDTPLVRELSTLIVKAGRTALWQDREQPSAS